MKPYGQHLLVEYHGCDAAVLDDTDRIESALRQAALSAGARVVAATFHRFAPGGVTGVLILEESHISIHTWPEHGYAAADLFTCGDCVPESAHATLRAALRPDRAEIMIVQRGARSPGPALQITCHRREWPAAAPGAADPHADPMESAAAPAS